MIAECVDTLRLGYPNAEKNLGGDVQQWFRDKYLSISSKNSDSYYTNPYVPTGKIFLANYNVSKRKKGYWDIYPIVFQLNTLIYNQTSTMLMGYNLNYSNPMEKAIFLDVVIKYYGSYIKENQKKMDSRDFSQYSFPDFEKFNSTILRPNEMNLDKCRESYFWKDFSNQLVVPIDYDDWKWLPLVLPFGIYGKPLREIFNIK